MALERLKPLSGWEDWAQGKKLKRRLDYDSAGKRKRATTLVPDKRGGRGERDPPKEDGAWTFKNGWEKRASNFIGPAISTWVPARTWRNG